jgi:hypothetical protein
MGLDYSYMLYFKKDLLWAALQAVADIALPHEPPTIIRFPDHELPITLEGWTQQMFNYDDPELDFATVLCFPEDEDIRSWQEHLLSWKGEEDARSRSPPDSSKPKQVLVGNIYLTIYTDLTERYPEGKTSDLVLFNFGTPGTSMSVLFADSASIRKTFVELLERVPGVCGVFNREDSGELFWREGQIVSEDIGNPLMLPGPRQETRFERS